MLLVIWLWGGFSFIEGLKIFLHSFSTSLACRPVAKDSEDSTEVASCTRIFSLDSIITAFISKFVSETHFSEDEHLVKFLYLTLEANNSRYAIGNEYHRLVVICHYGDNTGTLWNHSYALRSGIGNGIAIKNEEGIPNGIMSVIINDTYHLLRPNGKDEECEEEKDSNIFHYSIKPIKFAKQPLLRVL